MYMQRTTSGAAGNGLHTTIKYMRGASGIGMGTTIKHLRRTTSGVAGNGHSATFDTGRSENINITFQPTLSLRHIWRLRRCVGAYAGAYVATELAPTPLTGRVVFGAVSGKGGTQEAISS